MPFNTGDITVLTPTYWFKSQDIQNLITVRQDFNGSTPLERYAIVASKMRYSNSFGSTPIEDVATFTLAGTTVSVPQTITIPIRRQGSTFIYDITNSSDPIFYQLDKWHQYEHPEYWSKDFDFEAEVFDNPAGNIVIKTIDNNTGVAITNNDFTNYTTFVHYGTTANTLLYDFQPRTDNVTNDYTCFIRARNVSNGSFAINVELFDITNLLSPIAIASGNINFSSATSWTWASLLAAFPTLTDAHNYQLKITPTAGINGLDIDEILLTSQQFSLCSGTMDIPTQFLASQLSFDTYSNQDMNLKSTFIIDHDFAFTGCNIYAAPGTQILVMPGYTLTIDGSTFSACSQMWRGIKALSGSSILITNSTISDAQYGINGLDGSFIYTNSGTIFKNNYIGINASYPPREPHTILGLNSSINNTTFETNGTMKAGFPGQLPMPGAKGYAGINMENMGWFNVTSITGTNLFNNLYNGIIAKATSCNVSGSIFTNIGITGLTNPSTHDGSGIYVEGGAEYFSLNESGLGVTGTAPPTFNNCRFGIYTVSAGITAIDNIMNDITESAIVSNMLTVHDATISNNKIATYHNGIILNEIDGANLITIESNQIEVAEDAALAGSNNEGISVSANSNDPTNARLVIQSNYVNLHNNYLDGITLINLGDALVTDNHVNMFNGTYPIPTPAINLDACARVVLTCNQFNEDPQTNINNTSKICIQANGSKACTIGCNATRYTHDGFVFHNDCDDMIFRGNNIYSHDNGLHLSPTASIGAQFVQLTGENYGNEWLGTYPAPPTGYAAINENTIGLNQSLIYFDIQDNVGILHQSYQPASIYPTSGWFIPNPSTELECQTDFNCDAFRIQCEEIITDFDLEVANHYTPLSGAYVDEVRWLAERNLCNKIVSCPDLLSNQLLANFYNGFTKDESQRFFVEMENQLSNIRHWNSSMDSLFYIYDSLTNKANEAIDSINALIVLTHDEDTLHQYILQFNLFNQQLRQIGIKRNILTDNLNMNLEELLDTLSRDNLASTFSEVYEQNETTSNDIYYKTIARGLLKFSNDEKNQIVQIAEQCPYSGGPAVYRARSMRKIFESARYNDNDKCSELGIAWRKAQEISSMELSLKAIPNPSKSLTTVKFSLPVNSEGGVLFIYNSYGALIYKKVINLNQGEIRIDTNYWDIGIYSMNLISNVGIQGMAQLAVIK